MEDLHLQPVGERIDHGSADTVQTAGYLVSPAAEFAAGMKDRKNDFHRGTTGLVVDADGDPAAVIQYCDGIVRIDRNLDMIAETGQGFVNGVVNDFIDQMVQSAGCRRPDIHTGSFSDCFESL